MNTSQNFNLKQTIPDGNMAKQQQTSELKLHHYPWYDP